MAWEAEAPQFSAMIYTATAAELLGGGASTAEMLDGFLHLDEPSVIECVNAEDDARSAIAEVEAAEESVPPAQIRHVQK